MPVPRLGSDNPINEIKSRFHASGDMDVRHRLHFDKEDQNKQLTTNWIQAAASVIARLVSRS